MMSRTGPTVNTAAFKNRVGVDGLLGDVGAERRVARVHGGQRASLGTPSASTLSRFWARWMSSPSASVAWVVNQTA